MGCLFFSELLVSGSLQTQVVTLRHIFRLLLASMRAGNIGKKQKQRF